LANSRQNNHPPPYKSPGPSDARKIGLRFAALSVCVPSKAFANATPNVEDPKFPDTRATAGNNSAATPHCFASSVTNRGFG